MYLALDVSGGGNGVLLRRVDVPDDDGTVEAAARDELWIRRPGNTVNLNEKTVNVISLKTYNLSKF